MQERACAVYIMTNRKHGTLYIGVTSDLIGRVWEHREGVGSPFTRMHGLTRLVWFEISDWYDGARQREKAMKHWRRDWKIALIERDNPHWDDLWPAIAGSARPAPLGPRASEGP